MICTHVSPAADKGPLSLPTGKRLTRRHLTPYLTHILKRNKGACIEFGRGTDIPAGGDLSSPGCEDSPSLGKEVSQAQCPLLSGQAEVESQDGNLVVPRWNQGHMVGRAA